MKTSPHLVLKVRKIPWYTNPETTAVLISKEESKITNVLELRTTYRRGFVCSKTVE